MSDSPYRGPPGKRPDKRQREQQRADASRADAARREAGGHRGARPLSTDVTGPDAREPREQRLHGVNACLAMFAARRDDLAERSQSRFEQPDLAQVVAHCVKHRLGYTVVGDEDLRRLSGSDHHEGVVFATAPAAEANLSAWLRDLPAGPQLAIWLDGVGNPHNLGAILRTAAHFGVAGLLLPKHSTLALSGAAARVAEGGAERVPLVRLGRPDNALAQLRSAGFVPAATVVRGGDSLFRTPMPPRLLLMMGAEQTGIDPALAGVAALRLAIPGTGAVESLNVASATAVFVAEWVRHNRGP